MNRRIRIAAAAVVILAALLATAAQATTPPSPPMLSHDTTCVIGGVPTEVVGMILTPTAVGATYWLNGHHYVVQRVRNAETQSAQTPTNGDWSPWFMLGQKTGLQDTSLNCTGYFGPTDGIYTWVDSWAVLVK
jgi:hypothetical protein